MGFCTTVAVATGTDAAPPGVPLTRAAFARWDDRTVGELRAAVETGVVAKTELQVYGLDWSQLATERDDAHLADVVARRGARVGLDR